jgi:hypothetical protein
MVIKYDDKKPNTEISTNAIASAIEILQVVFKRVASFKVDKKILSFRFSCLKKY